DTNTQRITPGRSPVIAPNATPQQGIIGIVKARHQNPGRPPRLSNRLKNHAIAKMENRPARQNCAQRSRTHCSSWSYRKAQPGTNPARKAAPYTASLRSQLGREPATITPPDNASRGIRFSQISGSTNLSYGFSLAVGSDGNAYAWGYNYYGQLGDGTRDDKHAPVKVGKPAGAPADFTYLQVSAGGLHSLAVGS
ncbi:RCC1 domain-containing protein, partial [Bifidobacterium sp. H6bp9]